MVQHTLISDSTNWNIFYPHASTAYLKEYMVIHKNIQYAYF